MLVKRNNIDCDDDNNDDDNNDDDDDNDGDDAVSLRMHA